MCNLFTQRTAAPTETAKINKVSTFSVNKFDTPFLMSLIRTDTREKSRWIQMARPCGSWCTYAE